jgi:hypothetical protein
MLRQLEAALLVVIAATGAGGATHTRAVTGTCAPKDVRSDRLIAHFKNFVGETGIGGTILKKELGLTDVTPSQVTLVTDNAICSKAAVAYDRHLDTYTKKIGQQSVQKRSSYSLYVVTLGSSYAVEDTKSLQPGFETADVYDKDWKYIGGRQVHSNQ